jgi:hypothetical protein
MGLRLVKEELHAIPIDLDAPEPGLTKALEDIAHDMHSLGGGVKRDVRLWALMGAAMSSALTLGGVALLMRSPAPVAAEPTVQIAPAVAPVPVPQPVLPAQPIVLSSEPAPKADAAAPTVMPTLDTDASIRRALRLLYNAHSRQALVELLPVLEANPDNVDALSAQSLALFDLHRDREARAVVKHALKLSPQHPMANVLRGFMAQVDHDVPRALRHYNRYLRSRPHGAFSQELAFVRESLTTATEEDRHE